MQRYNFFLTLANLFFTPPPQSHRTAGELQERLLQSFTTVSSAQLWAQWKITWAMIILLPNRECNQKQKHKKNSLGAKWNASHLAVRLCALRHWKRVSMPPTTQSLRHPLTRAFHFAPRIKTARRFTAKNPRFK